MKDRYKLLIIALLAAAPGIAGALGASEELTVALSSLATVIAGLLRSPIHPKLPPGDLQDLK